MVFLGLSFLVCAVGLLFGHIAGFLPKGSLSFLGQGDLRSIAGLAVAGCLLAAIGYGEI
jgi:hypothetical protein